MTQLGGLPVGAGKGVFHGAAGLFKKGSSIEEETNPVPSTLPSGQVSQPIGESGMGGEGAVFPAMDVAAQADGNSSAEPGTLRVSIMDGKDFNPTGDSVKPYVVVRCADKEQKTKHGSKSSAPECAW